MDGEEWTARLQMYRRDTSRDHEQADLTATPGMFYHGSPDVNISQFRIGFDCVDRGEKQAFETVGIFFSHNPAYAAHFAAQRIGSNGGFGGRVYSAQLLTQNPLVPHQDAWIDEIRSSNPDGSYCRKRESEMIEKAKAEGYDSIISVYSGDTIIEMIVIDPSVIVPSHSSTVRVPDWKPDNAFDTLTLFQPDSHSAPFYGPEGSVELFKDAKQLAKQGRKGRKVLIDAENPIYCERAAWPEIDFDLMLSDSSNCLVDPVDRGALLLEPEKIVPLSRKQERITRAELRRNAKRFVFDTGQVALRGV